MSKTEKETLIQGDPTVKKYVRAFEEKLEREIGHAENVSHILTVPLNSTYRTIGVIRITNKINAETGALSRQGITDQDEDWLVIIASLVSKEIAHIKRRKRSNF